MTTRFNPFAMLAAFAALIMLSLLMVNASNLPVSGERYSQGTSIETSDTLPRAPFAYYYTHRVFR